MTTNVNAETINYLKEMAGLIQQADEDEKEGMLDSILDEISSELIRLVCDPASSRLLEQFAPQMNAEHLVKLLRGIGEEGFYQMAGNTFGSHIAEKILRRAAEQLQASVNTTGNPHEALSEVLHAVTDHVASSLLEYMTDRSATHVFRCLISTLVGRQLDEADGSTKKSTPRDAEGETSGRNGPSHMAKRDSLAARHWKVGTTDTETMQRPISAPILLPKHLGRLADATIRLLSDLDPSARRTDVLCHSYASPCIQTLLRALRSDTKRLQDELVPLALGAASAASTSPWATLSGADVIALGCDRTGSHILEAVLGVATSHTLQQLVKRFFVPDEGALTLVRHVAGNFVIQAALSAPHAGADAIEALLGALTPSLKELLPAHAQREGVIAAMANAALRVESSKAQRQFARALTRALRDVAPTLTNPALAVLTIGSWKQPVARVRDLIGGAAGGGGGQGKMRRNAQGGGGVDRLPMLGCVTLTALLRYEAELAAPYWDGLAELDRDDCLALARDPSGCRVLEAFLESSAPFKQRCVALTALEGEYGALAQGASGARLVEKCFAFMDVDGKAKIASELVASESAILKKPWGQYVFTNLDIASFKKGEDQFKSKVKKSANAVKEFQDLFANDKKKDGKRKKEVEEEEKEVEEEEEEVEEEEEGKKDKKKRKKDKREDREDKDKKKKRK